MADKQVRLARFWKRYLRLTRAGVPLLRALHTIAEEETDARFRDVVDAIAREIENGAGLSESLDKFPSEFSHCVRELIKTAERRGAWDEVLQELADGLADGTFE